MPRSSIEVANAFLKLAHDQGTTLDQMQLQELVYIAQGSFLAMHGKVLTGDSPEARAYGHEYPRLAESLASHGAAPLDQLIGAADNLDAGASPAAPGYFTGVEQDLIARVLSDYDGLTSVQMATLTRGPGSPWEQI